MLRCVNLILLTAFFMTGALAEQSGKQYYELREYRIASGADSSILDKYLNDALAPALRRQGLGPIGLFKTDPSAKSESRFLLIPLDNAAQATEIRGQLASDQEYVKNAAIYNAVPADSPVIDRIRSELLVAFDVQPQLNVPEICEQKSERIFELRTYESATEERGDRKVKMFNSGEVPIFLDCGIQPIFFGQAIIGDRIPNLTYMTVYPNKEAQSKGWDAFRKHPDWKVLSKKPEYAKTVSTIQKWSLLPMKSSQL